MKITAELFAAYLECPTKCWLRSTGEPPSGNVYAEWVAAQNESYRERETKRLLADMPAGEWISASAIEHLKTAKWRLALGVSVQTAGFETRLHAVERVPPTGRGYAAQFVPVRFVFFNKLLRDFKGFVVSDFHAAYDALSCPQQKCLIHLMRDLNDAVLEHPFDDEVKVIVTRFAKILRSIVATIDRRGLIPLPPKTRPRSRAALTTHRTHGLPERSRSEVQRAIREESGEAIHFLKPQWCAVE